MFGFLKDYGTYESRKIARFPDDDNWLVDTCAVSDGSMPFETAVRHKAYNQGKMVIVEAYETKEESQAGHDKWVKIMTAEKLPLQLVDCANSDTSKLVAVVGGDMAFERE